MRAGELGGFGDKRLARTSGRLFKAMSSNPTMCLHALADDRNEALAFGRLLDHGAVSCAEILTVAGRRTGARATGRHVLAIQDTTELNFPDHAASKRGFGRSGNGTDIGLFLHPTIAVDAANGGMIGLVGMQVLNRTGGKVSHRKRRPADAKESRRWGAAAGEAGEVLAGASQITVVADRESDVYDQFAQRPAGVDLLSRASHDRALATGGLLGAAIDAWPEQCRETLTVPPVPGRAAREACVALRFGRVSLKRPASADRRLPAHVDLCVIDVVEIDAPAGEAPLHWRLLTTHSVETVAQARQIVAWYRMRWTIEDVFRTLKSAALQVEASQVEEVRRFTKLAVVAMLVAVRIVQLTLARDGTTGQSLADGIDPAAIPALDAINRSVEGKTAQLKNPHSPDSLAWLSWIVARLGGWSGYTSKGYKPAGPKTLARGLTLLDGYLKGWSLRIHSADMRLP
jgi:hypothetical protein